MKKIVIILIILALITSSCSGQTQTLIATNSCNGQREIITTQNKDIMAERLDLELLEQNAKKIPSGKSFSYRWKFVTDDGTEIEIDGSEEKGFNEKQFPPKPAFFFIYKEYYENGNLRLKGKCMGGGATKIGEWEFYNKENELVSKMNFDENYGKFGYNELLLFLHQEGQINLETGKNREKVSFGYEDKKWWVSFMGAGGLRTEYELDGETGEVLSKKEFRLKM
ncbi:MAG: hypothetical protein FWE63_01700 [Bacteroidales bacterium]|nr:hypothetical protein [Bacteroidales bacterium]